MVRKFLSLCLAAFVSASLLTAPVMAQDAPAAASTEVVAADAQGTQTFKDRFIEGDPVWMAPVLLCLILGLAFVIERIIYLNMAIHQHRQALERCGRSLEVRWRG